MVEALPASLWGKPPPTYVAHIDPPVAHTIIHHSASPPPGESMEAEARWLRATDMFHRGARGMNQIAYSFVVMPSGRIWEGRGWGVVGGHTYGHNASAHAWCFAGNYQAVEPTGAALEAAGKHIAQGIAQGWVAAGRHPTWGHRDVGTTACPGDRLYAALNRIHDATGTAAQPPAPPVEEDDMPTFLVCAQHPTNDDGSERIWLVNGFERRLMRSLREVEALEGANVARGPTTKVHHDVLTRMREVRS